MTCAAGDSMASLYFDETTTDAHMATSDPPVVLDASDVNKTNTTTAAFASRQPTEIYSPPPRPDTPQLSLHEWRRFQQSPLLSSSPQLDYKRVRRKPSSANLSANAVQAAPSWTPSLASPAHIHTCPPHQPFHAFSPHPPTTPQHRPATGSPSLSSTVDTLQSTPTHTPIFRGGSPFEHHPPDHRFDLVEPVRTKRKFPALRHAKRLPHPSAAGSGSSADGLFEVYAAVFDTADEQTSAGPEHTRISQTPEQQRRRAEQHTQRQRAVRFHGLDLESEHDSAADASTGTFDHRRTPEHTLPTVTSSFSLSKFEFPVPPGQDNWEATGYLAEQSPPSSPATLHYRGASFDVVNPHASLLLGVHSIETPAEIDGLLDDYFHQQTEDGEMASYNELTGEPSQQSLGAASDRRVRVLFDNTNTARRHILHVDDNLPLLPPPKVLLNDSPLSGRSMSSLSIRNPFMESPVSSPPAQKVEPKLVLPSFPSIGLVLDSDEEHNEDVSKLEEGRMGENKTLPSNSSSLSIAMNTTIGLVKSLSRRGQAKKRRSEPFDLTLSDDGGDDSTPVARGNSGLRAENSHTDQHNGGFGPSQLSETANSQAHLDDQETDPIVGDIIRGYQYTSDIPGPNGNSRKSCSPGSYDLIRAISSYKTADPDCCPSTSSCKTSQNPFADDQYPVVDAISPESHSLPTPPTPVYHRLGRFDDRSELPTSEQTYGETNQLLMITPQNAESKSKWRSSLIIQVNPDNAPICKDLCGGDDGSNKENIPPSQSREYGRAYDDEPTPFSTRLSLLPGFEYWNQYATKGQSQDFRRTSSLYPDENESEWETQDGDGDSVVKASERKDHISPESYADTSADDVSLYRRSNVPSIALFSQELHATPPARVKSKKLPSLPIDAYGPTAMCGAEEMRRQANKAAIHKLKDKISYEDINLNYGHATVVDLLQRKLDLIELNRLRDEYPSSVRLVTDEFMQKAEDRLKLILSPPMNDLRKPAPTNTKTQKVSNSQSTKATGLGIFGAFQNDEAPRRRLPNVNPFSSEDNESSLEWSESMGTMVTVRDYRRLNSPSRYGVPRDVWSPFANDPNAQNLSTPQLPLLDFGNRQEVPKTIDTPKRDKRARGKKAAITGQIGLHELKLLRPMPDNRPIRGYSDKKLLERVDLWKDEPDLTRNGALVKYAKSKEVLRHGALCPRLGENGRDGGDIIPRGVIQARPPYLTRSPGVINIDWNTDAERSYRQLQARKRFVDALGFYVCVCPPLGFWVASGGAERRMAKKLGPSYGTLTRHDKRLLYTYWPVLGVFLWSTIIGFSIALPVIHSSNGGGPGPINGTNP